MLNTETQRPIRLMRTDNARSRCKRRNYYLENGYVKPIGDSLPEAFNPFDFYKTGGKDTESLHRQFANINLSNEKEILEFYNKYGALGLFQRDYYKSPVALQVDDAKYDHENRLSNVYAIGRCSSYLTPIDEIFAQYGIDESIIPEIDDIGMYHDNEGNSVYFEINACDTLEKIEDFKKVCGKFKTVLDLKSALDDKDYNAIKELLAHYSTYHGENAKTASNERLLSFAVSVILWEVIVHIEGMVTPLLDWNSDSTGISNDIAWRCDTLLSSIYLMLFMDITNNHLTRKCENEKCQRYFEANPSKKDNIYCSSRCRTAANVRKSRESKGV